MQLETSVLVQAASQGHKPSTARNRNSASAANKPTDRPHSAHQGLLRSSTCHCDHWISVIWQAQHPSSVLSLEVSHAWRSGSSIQGDMRKQHVYAQWNCRLCLVVQSHQEARQEQVLAMVQSFSQPSRHIGIQMHSGKLYLIPHSVNNAH